MPRDYWYLWQGQLISQLGTQAFQVLALFWLASQTHQAGAGALFLTCSLIPPILFGPFLARWSTKFAPKNVLMSCDFIAAFLTLPVLIAIVLSASVSTVVVMLLISNSLLAVVHSLMMPTLHSSVPLIVHKDKLSTANSWMYTTQQLASVFGQGGGGFLYAVIGPIGLCVANIVGFAVSGTFTCRMTSSAMCLTPPAVPKLPTPWVLLKTNIALRNTTLVSAVFNVLYAPWLVLLPFHLSSEGAPDTTSLGVVLAMYGLGTLVSSLIMPRLHAAIGDKLLPSALIVQAVVLVLLGLAQGPWEIALVLFVMGVGVGIVNVQLMTRIQSAVVAEQRSGAIAVIRASVYVATPLGYGAVALAQQVWGQSPGQVYIVCGLVLCCAMSVLYRYIRD